MVARWSTPFQQEIASPRPIKGGSTALFNLFGLAFKLCLFLALLFTADVNGGYYKGTLIHWQGQKLGRLPAKLLQTEVCIVRLWVTARYQFFASSTSSPSVLKPLMRKTSVT